jgi:hypothetical protein
MPIGARKSRFLVNAVSDHQHATLMLSPNLQELPVIPGDCTEALNRAHLKSVLADRWLAHELIETPLFHAARQLPWFLVRCFLTQPSLR